MPDVVIRNGTIYDGSGGEPYAADVAIGGDTIAAVMPAYDGHGDHEIDARGLAVAPGFVNMLSWAIPSLIADGRGQSDIRQGVTLEVVGEGSSMGPLTDGMRREQIERQGDIAYDIPWTTLREGLEHLTRRGVSPNVASFVGATTVRIHEVGYEDRPPTVDERARMRRLVRDAMRQGATGLNASMPPWVQEGGFRSWVERLRDGAVRQRLAGEMRAPGTTWENLYEAAGSAEKVLLVSFKNEKLKPLTGKTLAAVAAMRGRSPEETAMDLVVEDESRVGVCYFTIDEANVRRQVRLPWMSFGSDEGAPAPEGVFLKSNPHPRAYGTFARLLGHYVRDEGLAELPDAVRRLSAFPCDNLRLDRRGRIARGFFADVVIFDPATIRDHATYERPHRYATGVAHVFVNGTPVLRDGEHTGAMPGRVLTPRRD